MRNLNLILLLAAILALLTVSFTGVASSQDEPALFECFSRDRAGLLVKIETAALAWPGNNINVTINATATQANIHVHHVHVLVKSLVENRSETVLANMLFLENASLHLGDSNKTSYSVEIPEDSIPGLLYGEVEYAWSIEGDTILQEETHIFLATYIRNKPYRDLLETYGALEQQYQALADSHAAQENATGLMYVFLITTGIFVVTTILLLATHPRSSTY
jgi:hypothetical protein